MIVLEEIDTPGGRLCVTRRLFDGSTLLQSGRLMHSRVNVNGESMFLYIHLMRNFARLRNLKSVVVLGGGGGTLATMLHKDGCNIVQVDINPVMFRVAKAHFGLPNAVECIVADARDYMETCGRRFDAIFLDAFDEKGVIPRHLTTLEFFEIAARGLNPAGLIAANTLVSSSADTFSDRIAAAMSACRSNPVLFKDPDRLHDNVVVVGGEFPSGDLVLGDEPDDIHARLLRVRASRPRQACPTKDPADPELVGVA